MPLYITVNKNILSSTKFYLQHKHNILFLGTPRITPYVITIYLFILQY